MADASDFLFIDELSGDEQRALQERLAKHPELVEELRHWEQARAVLRERLARRIPDRELLVLLALDGDQAGAALTDAECERVRAARDELDSALEAHPALHDVVRRIREERDDFAAMWDQHFGPAPRERAGDRRAARREDRAPAHRTRTWRSVLGRVGAAVAVLAFAAIVTLLVQRDAGMVVVEVPEGTTRVVELADGTTVRLQGGARLTYPEEATAAVVPRRTRLSGRAFFDVVPGQSSFIVETPTAQATVLGTSFGVVADAGVTEVVLATGRLALAPRGADDRAVVLEPGQMSRVVEASLPTAPEDIDVSSALGWVDLFFFDRTPVPVIADRLADHYEVTIVVAAELREERVTGTFEKERGVEEILRVVAATLGADVEPIDGGYRLQP